MGKVKRVDVPLQGAAGGQDSIDAPPQGLFCRSAHFHARCRCVHRVPQCVSPREQRRVLSGTGLFMHVGP